MAFHQEIYDSLSHVSKLCLRRTKWRWGNPYIYRPRRHLIKRIAQQFGLSETEARNRLFEIRKFILQYPQYF